MATHGGAANSYYAEGQPQQQYSMQNPGGYPQGPTLPQYAQQPPQYGEPNGQKYGTPHTAPVDGNKQTFEQAFVLTKPKYNDLWAGILVIESLRLTYI